MKSGSEREFKVRLGREENCGYSMGQALWMFGGEVTLRMRGMLSRSNYALKCIKA